MLNKSMKQGLISALMLAVFSFSGSLLADNNAPFSPEERHQGGCNSHDKSHHDKSHENSLAISINSLFEIYATYEGAVVSIAANVFNAEGKRTFIGEQTVNLPPGPEYSIVEVNFYQVNIKDSGEKGPYYVVFDVNFISTPQSFEWENYGNILVYNPKTDTTEGVTFDYYSYSPTVSQTTYQHTELFYNWKGVWHN